MGTITLAGPGLRITNGAAPDGSNGVIRSLVGFAAAAEPSHWAA
jgi:hypothetical protein